MKNKLPTIGAFAPLSEVERAKEELKESLEKTSGEISSFHLVELLVSVRDKAQNLLNALDTEKMKSLKRGLEQAERGETRYIGSFSKFTGEEIPEDEKWVHENPEHLASYERALDQAKKREVHESNT